MIVAAAGAEAFARNALIRVVAGALALTPLLVFWWRYRGGRVRLRPAQSPPPHNRGRHGRRQPALIDAVIAGDAERVRQLLKARRWSRPIRKRVRGMLVLEAGTWADRDDDDSADAGAEIGEEVLAAGFQSLHIAVWKGMPRSPNSF